jgi:ATP/maltotriose-dependent transcriptional regulator MalT
MAATDDALAPVIEEHGTAVQRSQFHAASARRGLRETRYRPDEKTLVSAERAFAILEGFPDEFLRGETTFLLGFVQLWAERFADAEETLLRTQEIAHRFGDATHRLRALVYRSVGQRRSGHADSVLRLNDEALEMMRQIGSAEYAPIARAQEAWLAWRSGDAASCRLALEDFLGAIKGPGSGTPFQWLGLWVALAVDTNEGRLDRARQSAEAMLGARQARQRDVVERQLEHIVSIDTGDGADRLRFELEHGIVLACEAGYL